MMETQLIERDAQIQAQNAEIRALKRQHIMDTDALRHAQSELEPRRKNGGSPTMRAPRTPQSPTKNTVATCSLRKRLQQAVADKVVLVRALHQLTADVAQARAEARRYAAASERNLSTAWKLGQLGQLGLKLLELGEDDPPDVLSLDEPSLSVDEESNVAAEGIACLPSPTLSSHYTPHHSATLSVSPPSSTSTPAMATDVSGQCGIKATACGHMRQSQTRPRRTHSTRPLCDSTAT